MTVSQILGAILECKEKMEASMKDSFFSLTEAKYAAGDTISHTVFDNVGTAQVRCVCQCYCELPSLLTLCHTLWLFPRRLSPARQSVHHTSDLNQARMVPLGKQPPTIPEIRAPVAVTLLTLRTVSTCSARMNMFRIEASDKHFALCWVHSQNTRGARRSVNEIQSMCRVVQPGMQSV